MKILLYPTLAAIAILASLSSACLGQTLIGPNPYLSVADSPFGGLTGFAVDDFEDGDFDLLGVSASTGTVVVPATNIDSVDGDDGLIDGSGNGGLSFFSGNGSAGITFTFDALAIGSAPTSAGIVWTDGEGLIDFEAFDTNGVSIGTLQGNHADALSTGQTAEDRLYGVTFSGGIGSISISNRLGGIEVDHIQYATTAVPEPATASILAFGAMVVLVRRRRGR